MKVAYFAMKKKWYKRATENFKAVIVLGEGKNEQIQVIHKILYRVAFRGIVIS